MPKWGLVPSRRSGRVLLNNPIHDGCGVEMIIDKGVDRAVEILNNLEEYKAKTRDHIERVIKKQFTWEAVGEKLKNVIQKYL